MVGLKDIPVNQPFMLKDFVHYQKNKISSRRLFRQEGLEITGYALDEDESISTESSPQLKWITIMEGTLEVLIANEKFILRDGSSFVFTPGTNHALIAKGMCKFTQYSFGSIENNN